MRIPKPGIRFSFIMLLLCMLISQAGAQRDTVRIGAYINDIYDINLSEKSFSTQFWVWFNYRDSTLHPEATLEIPNAKSVEYSLDFSEPSGEYQWTGKKVNAVIKQDWDIRSFPFDAQKMTIELEESDKDTAALVYVPDTENTKLDPRLALANWEIERVEILAGTKTYNTTYGDPALSGSSAYAGAAINIYIRRNGWGLFFSLFTGLYVAFFISSLVFFIDPIDVDPRFGLSVGGLFAAVGNKYIVDSILPQSTTFTLVDKLHIITYLFLLLCIVLSVISLRMWKSGKEARSKKFDRTAYFSIVTLYFLINLALILNGYLAHHDVIH